MYQTGAGRRSVSLRPNANKKGSGLGDKSEATSSGCLFAGCRLDHQLLFMVRRVGWHAHRYSAYGFRWRSISNLSPNLSATLCALVINSKSVAHTADVATTAGTSFQLQRFASYGLHFLCPVSRSIYGVSARVSISGASLPQLYYRSITAIPVNALETAYHTDVIRNKGILWPV